MTGSWHFFLVLVILSILVHSFFSMMEMACVSFHKVRLHYFADRGKRRAVWLSKLLKNPTYLFGTTLIGLNVALQFGSECSRRFYGSIGLSPDLAPITQILLVLIFAELSPMFAARRFPEHVAMLGIGVIYICSRIMAPLIWLLNIICRFVQIVLRLPKSPPEFLTRDELQRALEEREERGESQEEFETVSTNVFALKTKSVANLMEPLKAFPVLPLQTTLLDAKNIVGSSFFLASGNGTKDIIGVGYPRHLLHHDPMVALKEIVITPWFVTHDTSVFSIIKEFRVNKQALAVVVGEIGEPVGVLTLEAIVEEIFQNGNYKKRPKLKSQLDRTFPGNTQLEEISKNYNVALDGSNAKTLDELMHEILGHHPTKGEVAHYGYFELRVEEAPLVGELQIRITTQF
ncbi:MAG: CNNM domain-containing protein [Candidatus Algichlamydia australiensis]|nr:CNNM domain-containing protein [Chlamydiales bacterium]